MLTRTAFLWPALPSGARAESGPRLIELPRGPACFWSSSIRPKLRPEVSQADRRARARHGVAFPLAVLAAARASELSVTATTGDRDGALRTRSAMAVAAKLARGCAPAARSPTQKRTRGPGALHQGLRTGHAALFLSDLRLLSEGSGATCFVSRCACDGKSSSVLRRTASNNCVSASSRSRVLSLPCPTLLPAKR